MHANYFRTYSGRNSDDTNFLPAFNQRLMDHCKCRLPPPLIMIKRVAFVRDIRDITTLILVTLTVTSNPPCDTNVTFCNPSPTEVIKIMYCDDRLSYTTQKRNIRCFYCIDKALHYCLVEWSEAREG